MKILIIGTQFKTTSQFFVSDALCDRAYGALKEAMSSYEKYKNDKHNTVSIQADSGEATYQIEALISVAVEDASACEATIIEREVWDKSIKDKVAARTNSGTAMTAAEPVRIGEPS